MHSVQAALVRRHRRVDDVAYSMAALGTPQIAPLNLTPNVFQVTEPDGQIALTRRPSRP